MGSARVTIGCALAVLAVSACTVASETPSPTSSCPSAGPEADLGARAFDSVPQQYARVKAGWYRLTASGFPHGGVLDPKVGRTTVVWGPAATPPSYDAGPATVKGVMGSADVVEGSGTWVQLPDATLWFLNSNGVRLALRACPPATFTVAPA